MAKRALHSFKRINGVTTVQKAKLKVGINQWRGTIRHDANGKLLPSGGPFWGVIVTFPDGGGSYGYRAEGVDGKPAEREDAMRLAKNIRETQRAPIVGGWRM